MTFVNKDHIGPNIPGLVWVSNHSASVSEAEAIHRCSEHLSLIPLDAFRSIIYDFPSGPAIAIYCEDQYREVVQKWHQYVDQVLSKLCDEDLQD